MTVWFEGSNDIECDIDRVTRALENTGEHFVGVVSLMPGMTSVELVAEGTDSVTIKTNEGVMMRTNIAKRIEPDRVAVEFDEEYQAGSKVTAQSRFLDEFVTNDTGVTHRLVMSDVNASGFLGFFYERLGRSKMGNAFLAAYKAYLQAPTSNSRS